MKSPLFRQEALDHQGRRSFGQVIFSRPLASSALVGFLLLVALAVVSLLATLHYDRRESVSGHLVASGGITRVQAPATGAISQLAVSSGDMVAKGQTLFEMSPESGQASPNTVVTAPRPGRVSLLRVSPSQEVKSGDLILAILPDPTALEAELLVPTRLIRLIEIGDPVTLRYRAFPHRQFGTHGATISKIAEAPLLPSELTGPFSSDEAVFPVTVALHSQEVSLAGQRRHLRIGLLLDADIAVERRSLLASLRLGNW